MIWMPMTSLSKCGEAYSDLNCPVLTNEGIWLQIWTGIKCIGIYRHQLSIVSGEFFWLHLAQHFLETIFRATLGVAGGCKQSVFGGFENWECCMSNTHNPNHVMQVKYNSNYI